MNATDESDSDRVQFITYSIILPVILSLGLILNLIGSAAVHKSSLGGVTRLYLVVLGVSNCIALALCIPFLISFTLPACKTWSWAFYEAVFEKNSIEISTVFSTYVLLCITVDRYFSLCLPTKFHRIHRPAVARNAVSLSFLLAVLPQIPTFFQFYVKECQDDGSLWSIQENTGITETLYWKIYAVILEILIRIGPGISMFALNAILIYRFKKMLRKRLELTSSRLTLTQSTSFIVSRQSGINMQPDARSSNRSADETSLVTWLTVMMILVVLGTVPSGLLGCVDYQFTELGSQIFRAVSHVLEILYVATSFILCCMSSAELRREVGNTLKCKYRRNVI